MKVAVAFFISSMLQIMPVTSDSALKTYEDYRAITDSTSMSYHLIQEAKHCEDGTLEIEGHKLVAMGQNYGRTGDKFVITFEDGHVLCVMMGDEKRYEDTQDGYCGIYGDVLEGIVDTDILSKYTKRMGDLNTLSEWSGKIIKIQKEVQR